MTVSRVLTNSSSQSLLNQEGFLGILASKEKSSLPRLLPHWVGGIRAMADFHPEIYVGHLLDGRPRVEGDPI